MKRIIITLLVLAAMALGLLYIHNRTSDVASSNVDFGTTNSLAITNGKSTWYLGAVVLNGTNVPLTNITIRAK